MYLPLKIITPHETSLTVKIKSIDMKSKIRTNKTLLLPIDNSSHSKNTSPTTRKYNLINKDTVSALVMHTTLEFVTKELNFIIYKQYLGLSGL